MSHGENTVEVYNFKARITKKISLTDTEIDESIVGGHGGGDEGIIAALYDYLNGIQQAEEVSEIEVSFKNHLLAFAAESSRDESKIVDLTSFQNL